MAIELQFLTGIEVDFDVTLTGLEMGEVDLLLGAANQADANADPADALPISG